MSTLFEVTDPLGNRISCDEDHWRDHIYDRHAEWQDLGPTSWTYVRDTIHRPWHIYPHFRHADRKVFYLPFILPQPYHLYYVKVIVHYDWPRTRRTGAVVTAYVTDHVSEKGAPEWTRS